MNTLSHFTPSDNHLIPPQGYPPTHYEYQTYQELPPELLRNIYFPPHQLPRLNPSMEPMQHSDEVPGDYEADQNGPLVEPKKSCQILSSEYANADEVYVRKTKTLARTHSHYRAMKGDGNCGWRAVAFGYFESLFQLRDTDKVAKELVRIKSFNQLLDAVGQDENLYDIFVDATEDLLLQVSNAIQNGTQDETFLLEAFNSEYNSNAIITHFRLVTSAYMKLNPTRYEAFLPVHLEEYCATRLETVKTEIDGVGLQGLVDGMIEGAGFGVEICYLDRSEGDAVTPHLLTPERQNLATIRLLYRPGHYDIIYQAEPQVLPQNQPVMQVNFQYSVASDFVPWGSNSLPFDMDPVLMSVPRLSMDACALSQSMPPSMPPTPQNAYPMYVSDDIHPPMVAQTPTPPTSSVHSSLPVSPISGMERSSELPIRMNPLVGEPMIALPLTTGPFRNSHYNQAHFQNPEFQPTIWDPSEEYK